MHDRLLPAPNVDLLPEDRSAEVAATEIVNPSDIVVSRFFQFQVLFYGVCTT